MLRYILRFFSKHFRKPDGIIGLWIARYMNKSNAYANVETIKLLRISPPDHILDIGFGNGKFTRNMANLASSGFVAGIDISETMVLEANDKTHNSQIKDRIEFTYASIEAIPYQNDQFDKVCSVHTVYFWQDEHQALKEVQRILKKNGVFVLTFHPNAHAGKHTMSSRVFRHFSIADIQDLFSQYFSSVNIATQIHQGTEIAFVIAEK